jgi:predicted RNA-binding Zn-ribbon protein involved in translation (DUF1610 family)
MLRFNCDNCGCKIKVPDKHAGRKGKCPKCGQIVLIPAVTAQEPIHNKATTSISSPNQDMNALKVTAQDDQTDTTTEKTMQCPYCGETILAVAKKCKHCKEFLDVSSRAKTAAVKPDLDVSQLREEYERLQRERKNYNRLGLYFGVPGSIIVIFANILIAILWDNLANWEYFWSFFFVTLAGTMSLGVSFSYYAKYKGRSPWLGLLVFIPLIISVLILLLLKDYKRERMNEIICLLKTEGKSENPEYDLSGWEPDTSEHAKASFYLSLFGFCTAGITSIVGLILGVKGLKKIKMSKGKLKGRTYAIIGIIISIVSLLLFIPFYIVVLFGAFSSS